MFYERIKLLCKGKNIKITNLIKELDMSSGVLSKWKSGDIPRADTLIKISDYFNISIDYLLDKTDDPTPPNKKNLPLFTEDDILQMLAEVKDLSDDEVAHLKSTLKIIEKTHEARQISERLSEKLNEETSDELAPESN